MNSDIFGHGRKVIEALLIFAAVLILTYTSQYFLHSDSFPEENKIILFQISRVLILSILMTVLPMILSKSFDRLKEYDFSIPLILVVILVAGSHFIRIGFVLSLVSVIYLHNKFDFTQLGMRTTEWKKDVLPFLMLTVLIFIPLILSHILDSVIIRNTVEASRRIFSSEAIYFEALFFLGFLSERINQKWNKPTAVITVTVMYTIYDMTVFSNWNGNSIFIYELIIFLAVILIYFRNRNIVVIWLAAGFWRLTALLI